MVHSLPHRGSWSSVSSVLHGYFDQDVANYEFLQTADDTSVFLSDEDQEVDASICITDELFKSTIDEEHAIEPSDYTTKLIQSINLEGVDFKIRTMRLHPKQIPAAGEDTFMKHLSLYQAKSSMQEKEIGYMVSHVAAEVDPADKCGGSGYVEDGLIYSEFFDMIT